MSSVHSIVSDPECPRPPSETSRGIGVRAAGFVLLLGCGPADNTWLDAGLAASASSAHPQDAQPVAPSADLSVPPNADTSPGILFDPRSGFVFPDAGTPPPVPLRSDGAPPSDQLAREDLAGVLLDAEFKLRRLPSPPKGGEIATDTIGKVAKASQLKVSVELFGVGRARLKVLSKVFPFAYHTELRSRFDRTGTFLIWPDASQQRVLAPGALRNSLGERRADVSPLVRGTTLSTTTGNRLGEKTRIVTLEAPLGKLQLEVANIPEAALGGPLLCRMLVELMAIDPMTNECKPDEVVLRAGFNWIEGPGLDFEVTSLAKKVDLPAANAMAPTAAAFVTSGLPESPGVFLSRDELAAFRTKPVETKREPQPGAPGEGVLFVNGRTVPLYALIDGVVVASVPPNENRYLIGPVVGRYHVEWRDFFGDFVETLDLVEFPAKVETPRPVPSKVAGAADAGPPN